jgi:hypothetical protein
MDLDIRRTSGGNHSDMAADLFSGNRGSLAIARHIEGIGAMFEFRTDGTFNYSPGAIVPGGYRLEGDHLIVSSKGVDGPPQRCDITWTGDDRLKLTVNGDHSVDLSRSGPRVDATHPIVGEWIEKRNMGGHPLTGHWFFYADGKSLFLLPFVMQPGRYTAAAGTIQLDLSERGHVSGKFTVAGDMLTLPSHEGTGESRYQRY